MECILFRHGIAVERTDWDGEESLRPLTPEGKTKTRKALAGIHRFGVRPTHLFSSPLARALQTAQLAQEVFGLQGQIQIANELLPDAPPEDVLAVLGALPADACAVLVGHEPHLGSAASVMLFGKSHGGLSLKKAGACSVAFDAKPRTGRGSLTWWLKPSQLRSLAKR